MSVIPESLQEIRRRIQHVSTISGRDSGSVRLLAVSKTFKAAIVREAFDAGQRAFGENYVQEGLAKIAALEDLRDAIDWHFIGPLQTNKTRAVAEAFDWVHTIDRLKIAERLAAQRPAGMAPLQVCIQVNISEEASKSGVVPQDVLPLAQKIVALPGLVLRGLMAIPEPAADAAAQRIPFAALRQLLDDLRKSLPPAPNCPLDTLSMGMSADLDAAIAEGATIVRIGTAIFGKRTNV